MNNKKIIVGISSLVLLLAGCSVGAQETLGAKSSSQQQSEQSKHGNAKTKGDKLNKILGKTNWQGTKVYDKDNNDLTAENANFIGLAKYDAETGRYEFFDAKTGESRGDRGTFFITNDGTKRILISETMNYQAVVGLTELTNKKFTYTRKGKDKTGNEVDVFVEHIPYNKSKLAFTEQEKPLNTTTGKIETKKSGAELLGQTLWNGTKVVDESGNDVTEYNKNFISLAKFAADTNKYEFFNLETGVSRGDFGYFDVLNHNKIRAHVSIGQNKYGAALELTELNNKKFTYKRMGKDQAGKDITVFVEHQPYTGKFKPEFSF
ncbi:DUF4822 domain-containing protein [Candidatus Enterococcus ikei]|uniref:DUF4822 domain-containing protein n=1 Tax=Candidatus Enterococcus ikei TaxID=2815326 RepID=A0ABS3H0H0_9ENTE|nr:DUF4822 domain-containing protein [Enterococcus sp. DIV0869a]MBO0440648.1 DUF4822 domain-containing protein [Enterococcus sp. DIV0869a]